MYAPCKTDRGRKEAARFQDSSTNLGFGRFFTAWSKNETIDIDAYAAYIKENQQWIEYAVNLDKIPGKPGKARSQKEVEESAEQSFKNWEYLQEKYGIKTLPVFHQGERFDWLFRYIKDGADYVGISPMADSPQPTIQRWMDEVFTLLTDDQGRATIRTHGFGVSAFRLLKRFPWYSCDAATWALIGGRGEIYLPVFKHGKFDYSEIPLKIKMSGALPKNDKPASDGFLRNAQAADVEINTLQFDNLGPTLKKLVIRFLEQEVGVTLIRAKYDDRVRYKATAYFLTKFGASLSDVRFQHRVNVKFTQ